MERNMYKALHVQNRGDCEHNVGRSIIMPGSARHTRHGRCSQLVTPQASKG